MSILNLSASLRLWVVGLLILFTTIFFRLIYIHPAINRRRDVVRLKKGPSHLVVVLGSGGHTAEMMSLLRDLDPRRYIHRTYIVSSGDNFSTVKAHEIEKTIQSKHSKDPSIISKIGEFRAETGIWEVKTVPRARKIHQSLYTAPFSSLLCLIGCLNSLREASRTSRVASNQYPDAIITNGPATAVIAIVAAFLLKLLGFAPASKMKIIYVESWARVRSLSLSGRVLLYLGICERFLVQWEALADGINGKGKDAKRKAEWLGFLVD